MDDPLLNKPAPPERVCAVCGFTLDHLEGGGYFHAAQVAAMAGHIPVPVDPAEVTWSANKLCDFCTGVPAPWIILTDDDFIIRGGIMAAALRGDWYACPTCIDLVRRKRWTELVNRVHAKMSHIPRRTLRETYSALETHVIGFALAPADE
jgi:hypothetical protein